MKVTYLNHSGFLVELEHMVLLFDYYMGKLPDWPKDKALFVFASHSHPDHFNWKILRLADSYPRIHYFFGNDIRLGRKWLEKKNIDVSVKEKITKMAGGQRQVYEDGNACIRVRTLKSTDIGVAFLLEAEGKRIYHAGDLNWWHWEGEPEQDNREMEAAFKKEIDSISGEHFDLAFVPLDPRLENSFALGLNYFLKKTDSPLVFPMHLWGKYETIEKYKRTAEGMKYAGRVADVAKGGETWNI